MTRPIKRKIIKGKPMIKVDTKLVEKKGGKLEKLTRPRRYNLLVIIT